MKRLLLPVPFVLVTTACGPAMEGDWFNCQDLSCNQVTSQGMRFTGDGRLHLLGASGATLDPEELYCHTPEIGTWTLEGEVLTVSMRQGDDAQTMAGAIAFSGELATVDMPGAPVTLRQIVDRESFRCAAGDDRLPGTTSGPGARPKIGTSVCEQAGAIILSCTDASSSGTVDCTDGDECAARCIVDQPTSACTYFNAPLDVGENDPFVRCVSACSG